MASTHVLGKQGEELALRFLREKGYKILQTNWRFGHNELDLIARDGDTLVIVEVKTRQSALFGEPEEAVTRDKQRAIIRSANAYVKINHWSRDTRFDIISIILNDSESTIRHLPDAFMARLV